MTSPPYHIKPSVRVFSLHEHQVVTLPRKSSEMVLSFFPRSAGCPTESSITRSINNIQPSSAGMLQASPKRTRVNKRKSATASRTHYECSSAFPRHSIYTCRASEAVASTPAYPHCCLTSSLQESGGINCTSEMRVVIWGIDDGSDTTKNRGVVRKQIAMWRTSTGPTVRLVSHGVLGSLPHPPLRANSR